MDKIVTLEEEKKANQAVVNLLDEALRKVGYSEDNINGLTISGKIDFLVIAAQQSAHVDDADLCDCGEPFPESGYCKFCGAHQRHLQ